MFIPILSSIALAIIIVLAVVAWRLQKKVKVQQQAQLQQQQAEEQEQRKKRAYITESIQVIAMNVIQQDLNLSEATIRCKILLDALYLTPEQRQPYAILETVYEQISQFATHQARKTLSKTERIRQDAEREAVEEANRDALIRCFTALAQQRLQ